MSEKRFLILLVGAEPSEVNQIKMALKDCLYLVDLHVANDAVDALQFLRSPENPVPISILLDIDSPRVTGLEFLSMVKQDVKQESIPVIVIASSQLDEYFHLSNDLGADNYLVKPILPSWFNWHVDLMSKPKFRTKYLCPCCAMPTLDRRARYLICPICYWEDDGEEYDGPEIENSNLRYCGPNGYALVAARGNFRKFHTMYRPEDIEAFEREQSEMPMKKAMYKAYEKAMSTNSDVDWEMALKLENEYYRK